MLLACGAIGTLLGAAAAVCARRLPAHQAPLEQGAGLLIVLGLGLIGAGFPLI